MRRVMIIGQPGSGKSTLARAIGEITHLPVFHMDQIHWMSGWKERSTLEKARLVAEVEARENWVFEGGYSKSWTNRSARADTLIWIDIPLFTRSFRVLRRTITQFGKTRLDLPDGCPERFSLEFYQWIWNTRKTGRDRPHRIYDSLPEGKAKYWLRSGVEMDQYISGLRQAAKLGNLGISHR